MTTTQPATDVRTAQEVATGLVAQALRQHRNRGEALEHHGDWWAISATSEVRTNARPGQLDGIVSLTIVDEGTGEQVGVTLMVAAAPLGVPETPPAVPSAPARGAGVEGRGEAVSATPLGAPARPVDTPCEDRCVVQGCLCALPLGHAGVHMCAFPDHTGWLA